jgi:hypothetical protein
MAMLSVQPEAKIYQMVFLRIDPAVCLHAMGAHQQGLVRALCVVRCVGGTQLPHVPPALQFYLEYLAALPPKFRDLARPLGAGDGSGSGASRRRKAQKGAGPATLAQVALVAKVCHGATSVRTRELG